MSYGLWFRGIAKLTPASISTLGFLSPLMAVILGWLLLEQHLTSIQVMAVGLVLFSIWLSQQLHLSLKSFIPFIQSNAPAIPSKGAMQTVKR